MAQVSENTDRDPIAQADGVTVRCVILGLGLVVCVNTWPIYGLYVVHINQMVFSYMAMALMIPFALLSLGFNVLLRRYWPCMAFSPLEMAVVFSMGLVGSLFPLMNFTGLIMGHLATPYYFASAQNRWSEFLHPHLPAWLFPTDDGGAMRYFFEGLPPGRAIPWDVWVVPLFWWFAFAGAIIWTCLCLAVMLRRQWAEHEKLPFPAAQVALELVQRDGDKVWPPLVGRKVFWIGVAIPLTVICWNMLSYFMPDFPRIPITRAGGGVTYLDISRYIPRSYFYIGIQFFIAGFAYWTSLEVLFSIWFFYLLVVGEVYTFNRMGYSVGTPGLWSSSHAANAWQAFGALAFMLFWGLWMGREHLKGVWANIRGRKAIDDSEELIPYRTAGIGFIVGLIFMVGWLYAAGMAFHVILPFLIGMAILYVGIARVIAESGLVYLRGTIMPPTFALYVLGSANISQASMANLAFSFAYFTDAKSLAMASMAHCAWITAAIKGRKRLVAVSLVLAGVTAAVTSVAFTLYLGYETGAYNFNAFEFTTHASILNYWVAQMQTFDPPDWKRLGFFGFGVVGMGLLTFLRYRVAWWPLHPVGFAIMETQAVRGTIFTIFLVWLCKLLILRIGGIALYRKGQPLFLGILVGFIIGVALSAAVDTLWFPGSGHSVHHW
ncbi:MAG: hypothetical protein O3B73_12020 [bacterium]|nr:hypothetical protein [bacterium]